MNRIRWLADINTESDAPGSSEIKQIAQLRQAKFPIPPAFVISTNAYRTFLQENSLDYKITQLLSTISHEHADSLMQGEALIRQLFEQARLPGIVHNELVDFYRQLGEPIVSISIHESGPHERKHATFTAGSITQLEEYIKNAWAEMFTGNALWHRHQRTVDHLKSDAEIIVQEKINGNTTGVIFTIDPHNHTKDKLILTVTHPHAGDTYILSKKNLTILDRQLSHTTKLPKLTHEEILAIASMAKKLETHLYFPQEISWTLDGDMLYILKTKPISSLLKEQDELKKKLPLGRGKGITPLMGTGVITIIHTPSQFETLHAHDIVIAAEIQRKYLVHLKKIRGLILENKTHPEVAAMLQKHGIPALAQVRYATRHFKNGQIITIHGGKGEIYSGGFL